MSIVEGYIFFFTLLHIVQEYLFHAQCHLLLIEEDVAFEIVLKTSEVHIRRTACRDNIIAYQ